MSTDGAGACTCRPELRQAWQPELTHSRHASHTWPKGCKPKTQLSKTHGARVQRND